MAGDFSLDKYSQRVYIVAYRNKISVQGSAVKTCYLDIIEKAGSPLWYDENGVPRYVEFHPNLCVMTSAEEAFLVEVVCQGCGTVFRVALTWKNEERCIAGHVLPPPDRLTKTGGSGLHYGDPPNVGCCVAGPTMSSDFHRIIEAWVRSGGQYSQWIKLEQDAIDAIGAKSEVGTWE